VTAAGTPGRPDRDEAYSPLEAPDALPALSLLAFVTALAARPLVGLLPAAMRSYPRAVLLPVALALIASAIGTLLALWALRRPPRRGLARIALLLNGIVLILTALAAAGVVYIIRR